MEEGQSTIRVNGREIMFPPAALTIGEMADAENYFGADFNQPDRSGMRLIAAFLYIAIRRVDATVTVDDVRALDPAILEQLTGGDAGPPDETGTSERSGDASPAVSDGSANGPSPTGSRGSATGTPSDPMTSPP